MIGADLTRNPKQALFFETAIEAAYGFNPYRYLFYGGAIRGGKTFACLVTLIVLCRLFPGSKWYVLRKSFTRLQETTLPTMHKILGNGLGWKWNRDKSNYYVEHLDTRSRIYFAGEDYATDPNLDWMLGLECNGFVLEQIEELQEKTFDMAISRAGSWIIPNMPTPLILSSFNPTVTWVRGRIYEVWREGKLEDPYFFLEASALDNPFVTPEQWKSWKNLPDEMYKQYVGGSWDFAKLPNLFAYSFNDNPWDAPENPGHHKDVGYNNDLGPLYCSFDFNVEPITCLTSQHAPHREWIHICKEYRLLVSDIWALTDHIVSNVPEAFFMVTGDASGRNRTAITKGNRNYYQIIKQQFNIGTQQIKVPNQNPGIRNTRVLCNALLQKHPAYFINKYQCPHLTIDLNSVQVKNGTDIDKSADKRKSHLLDCWRYYNWTFHRDFIDRGLYQLGDSEDMAA